MLGATNKKSLSLVHYLQSRYLGLEIDYSIGTIVPDASQKKGEVSNVVTGKEGYFFILVDGTWVKVIFQAQATNFFARNGNRRFKSKKEIQIQLLKNEQFINSQLAKVGAESERQGNTTFESISQAEQLIPDGKDDFTSSEEIIYTDLNSGRQAKGNVLVSSDGLVLEDGTPISIQFVSGRFGSRN